MTALDQWLGFVGGTVGSRARPSPPARSIDHTTAPCSPNARSTTPQVRSPPSNPCWTGPTLPASSSPPTHCTATPPGRASSACRQLLLFCQGQPAHPARPLRPPCLAQHPRARPHPRPRARPRRARSLKAITVHRLRVPARLPRSSRSPAGPRPRRPVVADRDRLRVHQPTFAQASPARLADCLRGPLGDRERPAPRPRCHLRRRRLPDSDRHRPTHDGVPAQLGDRCAQPRRAVNLAAALGHHARDPARPVTTLGLNRTLRQNAGALPQSETAAWAASGRMPLVHSRHAVSASSATRARGAAGGPVPSPQPRGVRVSTQHPPASPAITTSTVAPTAAGTSVKGLYATKRGERSRKRAARSVCHVAPPRMSWCGMGWLRDWRTPSSS